MSSQSSLFSKTVSLVLVRMRKVFVWPWIGIVATLTGSRCSPPIVPTVLAAASLFLIAISVYIYNDVTDLEMDRLNPTKRDRPLPSGRVTVKEAMNIVYVCGLAGLALSLLVNVPTFLLCATFMALYLFYSDPRVRLKRRFILKEGTIAAGNLLSSLIGGTAIGSVSPSIVFLGLFLSAYAFVGAPIDEISDIVEDEKFGCRTIPMVIRWKRLVQLFMGFLLVVMFTMPLTYRHLGFNTLFPIIVVLSSGLSMVLLFPLLKKAEAEKMLSVRELMPLYIPWITTHVAVILGTL